MAEPPQTTRRELIAQLGVLVAAALAPRSALAQHARPAHAAEALAGARELSFALARHRIEPTAWQDAIEEVLGRADPAQLLEQLEVDRVARAAPRVPRGASVARLPHAFGPTPAGRRQVSVKLFFLEAGRANPPHAHDHMVSAHLVLRGRFRYRHFERVRDERGAIVVRPSLDRVLGPGELTSVSDARDNVHWHLAESDGVLLDVLVSRLHPSAPTDRHMLDVERGERLGDGLVRAPILSRHQALARYG